MNFPTWFSAVGLTETALQAAAIGGAFTLLGILLAALILALTLGRNRRADRRLQRNLRRDRTLALQHAIRTEVRAHWYELDRAGSPDALAQDLIARIDEGRWTQPSFTPFIAREAPTLLWGAIERDSSLLDPSVIQLAIYYYRQAGLVDQLAEDLRSPRCETLSADRKIELVRTYFAALATLKRSAALLNEGLESAMRLRAKERDPTIRAGVQSGSNQREQAEPSTSLAVSMPPIPGRAAA